MIEIELMIEAGDKKAQLICEAMIYNVAKAIGGASTVLNGRVDAILLTGGLSHSDYVIERLCPKIEFIAPIHVYPGEDELEALALNAYGALTGELPIIEYE